MSDVRLHVYNALQMMAKMGDIIRDTHGNVSAVDRTKGVMYIKPSGVPYDEISAIDICAVSMNDGKLLEYPQYKPSVDTPNHLEIYRNNFDINAICHTHSPYATAYAILDGEIPCVCTEHADFFGEHIFCSPYASPIEWGRGLIVPHSRAVLLEKHGTLTFGGGPEKAVKLAAALENVAQKTYLAATMARSHDMYISPLSDVQRVPWHTRFNGGGYGQ